MAIPKVLGTETEYGVIIRNRGHHHQALAAAAVIDSYPGGPVRVQWSYEHESPGSDSRGFGHENFGMPDPESALINSVLTNGARLYVDHSHPEYSGPECFDPREGALYDKVGELVMARAGRAVQETLPPNQQIRLYKNNSDGKSSSYGAHENFLLSRRTPFGKVIQYLPTFLVSRQIYTGSGKVGSENHRPFCSYQITQRADFFEEVVGLETTLRRPIINTRDEPHGDPTRYRRLHIIIGDANLSEVQIFLKLGVTALFLHALEDDALPSALELAEPVKACWRISHDLTLAEPLEMSEGGTMTALDLQFLYLEWLSEYARRRLDDPVWDELLEEWEGVLVDLEEDPMLTSDRLDWTAKLAILEAYRARENLSWSHPRLAAMALQYHDVEPSRSIYHRLVERGAVRRLFTDAEVERAEHYPPEGTRAWFRGTCVSRFGESLVAANWDSLLFETNHDGLIKVSMMEPLEGGRVSAGPLLGRISDPAELIRELGEKNG